MTSLASQSQANVAAIPLILTSVILGAVGQLTMKTGFNVMKGAQGWGDLSFAQKLPHIFLNPNVLAGLALYVIATFVWFAVLDKADLSFAYPFIALAYVVTMVGGRFLLGEHLNGWKYAAVALIIVGVLCLAKGASEKATAAPLATPASGQP